MGKVYYDMGFLSTAEVIECSATDLIGQYIGHTGPKTQRLLEKALGRVLFIDEAYRLAGERFAKEAMDEIVDCITKPKFARKLIIILAGYDADINRLMSSNPGLTSRFPEAVIFRGISADECITLFTNLLRKRKHQLSRNNVHLDIAALESPRDEFIKDLRHRFEALSRLPNWANCRDVETVAKSIFGEIFKSDKILQGQSVIDEKTVLVHIDSMISERAHRGAMVSSSQKRNGSEPAQIAADIQIQRPPVAKDTESAETTAQHDHQKAPTGNNDVQDTADGTQRDPGVSDEVWARLQQDKLAEEAREQAYKKLLEEERAMQESVAESRKAESDAAAAVQKATTSNTDDEEKRRHEEARLQHELERRKQEAELEVLRRKKQEAEERRRKEQEAQKKLRHMGVCVAGFRWIKQAGGYRCAGGMHYVSDAQLGMS